MRVGKRPLDSNVEVILKRIGYGELIVLAFGNSGAIPGSALELTPIVTRLDAATYLVPHRFGPPSIGDNARVWIVRS